MKTASTELLAPVADLASLNRWATAPLDKDSGIEDPRHHPTLLAIKQAMGRLQGTDFDQVIQDAGRFLGTQAKDLRVAGYLWLALVTRDQIPGLMTGTSLYRQLLASGDGPIHPCKPAQRRAALDWLNSERVRLLLNQLDATLTPDQVKQIEDDLEHIETRLEMGPWDDPDMPPRWHILRQWLQARRIDSVADTGTKGNSSVNPEEGGLDPSPPPEPRDPARVLDLSTETLVSSARNLHDALQKQGRLIEAWAFARAARWAGLTLPPHDRGMTRIPPPRAGGWATLDEAQARGDWACVLASGAALFFEPGFHLALDLQHRLANAAEQHQAADLALDIQAHARVLIQRLPGLEALSFDDGRPFADAATLAWLQGGLTSESLPASQSADAPPSTDHVAAEPDPDTLSALPLPEAWQVLERWPMNTERQRLTAAIARAELCLRARRPDVALPILQAARAHLEVVRIMDWDPAMGTILITRLHQVALMLSARGVPQETLIGECEQELARLDPQAAMASFSLPEGRSRTAAGPHDNRQPQG
ncbi:MULTISPECIES: TssA family type VI secretion system protein [unclassified Ectothiorhodospira]|uniref:TssA family type VI secretion system protein n=1 Tax=unclassified Ectothiorhodospira TaxID=2684909 RepID=UPI001EE7C9B3|nr:MULTISPECIES: TssA family type VI secretion system protein [unclassified Ectothiorhodospira]MCG5515480.1 TssA family type VI secretion system protein [Ectothiorhodospira sp. 9100]MCG5518147.1 TssA family type VI secretion system protein [Ectothiorhodospira sp. 9905]